MQRATGCILCLKRVPGAEHAHFAASRRSLISGAGAWAAAAGAAAAAAAPSAGALVGDIAHALPNLSKHLGIIPILHHGLHAVLLDILKHRRQLGIILHDAVTEFMHSLLSRAQHWQVADRQVHKQLLVLQSTAVSG